MINLYVLCGITTIVVIIIIVLKKVKSEFVLPLSLLFGIILLRQALNLLHEHEVFFKNLVEAANFNVYWNVILKAFGVSMIIEVLSDFCKEVGENSIASKIELLGKIEIIVLSFPLIEKLLEIVKTIIL